jgi:hypothetical protein
MHLGKVITGAPYSATVTNTLVKTLADGNTIQRTTTGIVARDSQGRTYSQETITLLGGQGGTRTVTFISDPVAGYSYMLDEKNKTAIRRALHTNKAGGGADNAEVAGGHDSARAARPANPNVVAEDLPAQVMNGVNAVGKRMTRTIPAGQMGNEKPIVTTSEVWKSPDLQVDVYSKRTDPQQGTSTYALTNITRAEPTSVSFAVPAGYTVKDAPSFGGRH